MRQSRRFGWRSRARACTEGTLATYAIGDIQGCFDPLQRLLDRLSFDPAKDKLWVAGDLINRGPQSLETVQYLRALGEAAQVVLGNHDLHLLAVLHGARRISPNDTFQDLLNSPARNALVEWLATRPLLVHDRSRCFAMVHAGLVPQWTIEQARSLAAELETMLRSERAGEFFQHMYGDGPDTWRDDLEGWDRLRFITNALTRLRYCTQDGTVNLRSNGPPGTQPSGFNPWYAVPNRASAGERVLFGHWATLALEPSDALIHRAFHLDTGCVWGGRLTAMNLESLAYTSEPARPEDLRRS